MRVPRDCRRRYWHVSSISKPVSQLLLSVLRKLRRNPPTGSEVLQPHRWKTAHYHVSTFRTLTTEATKALLNQTHPKSDSPNYNRHLTNLKYHSEVFYHITTIRSMIATKHLMRVSMRASAHRGVGLLRPNTRPTPTFRCLATTPRSAKTQNPDINDDNILPVGCETCSSSFELP